jgi:3-oxoacyl-ACP reductase-like protein
MSIFGSIVSAIFGHKSATPVGGAAATPAPQGAPTAGGAPATPAPQGAPTAGGAPATGKPMTTEEVEAMIEKIADAQDEDYNWEESIVDLMKLLKLDSSLSARKQLAQELGYTGALDGSAEMNIWLHKQVMTKLAEGGGAVPASLKHA